MADITLRDRNGAKVNYPGIDIIKLNAFGGDVQNYGAFDPETLTPDKLAAGVTVGGIEGTMTAPEIVENMPIALDFSGGNQSIVAPDGVAVKSAIIQKPETLTPENIAEGVNIAGILGTLAAGGSVKIASGTFTGNGGAVTVTHNLGVIPDVFIAFPTGTSSLSGGSTSHCAVFFGISQAFKDKTNFGFTQYGVKPKSSSALTTETSILYGVDNSMTSFRVLYSATSSRITVGSSYAKTFSTEHTWLAIGGLT